MSNSDYWYDNRHLLEEGDIFLDYDGDRVRLNRRVPGDGTQWYVDDWDIANESWALYDRRVEPGDLRQYES